MTDTHVGVVAPSWTRSFAVLVVIAIALTSCAADPVEVSRGDVRAWVLGPTTEGDDQGIGGIIRYIESGHCFVLTPDGQAELPLDELAWRHPVIWPHGTTLLSGDTPQLNVPDVGTVSIGDHITGRGTTGPAPDSFGIPDDCFLNTTASALVYEVYTIN